MTPERLAVLKRIGEHLVARDVGHPLRVGIDGVCGVGKSTFARDLAAVLEGKGRPVALLDSDGFHHVRQRRYRQGRNSARGYYEDAYDFDSLADLVLRPLGPDGDRQYAVKVHELASDAIIDDMSATAPPNAMVIFDATFVQRDGLRELWDEVIYLHADESAAQDRGVARDARAMGGEAPARAAYDSRYMAACRIYLAEQHPRERATIVVEHTDPRAPAIARLSHTTRR